MKKIYLYSGTLLFLFLSMQIARAEKTPSLGQGYEFEGNGKRHFPCRQPLYQKVELPEVEWDFLEYSQQAANRELKRNQQDWTNGSYSVNADTLINTLSWLKKGTKDNKGITATLIHGEDGCGNTHFTGYFTPVLKLKSRPDKNYRYPLYRIPTIWPDNQPLTRRQIDMEKGLDGSGLELGYSSSLLDNYFAHVQGSVQAQYIDTGKTITLAYGGKNGFSYQSLGRYLVENGYIEAQKISLKSIRQYYQEHPNQLAEDLSINDSYTFFHPVDNGPFASSGAQVTPLVTAAVDPVYLPHGAVLLAEIPIIDGTNHVSGYNWRLLVAQDRGAAIKGPGHIDIYMGVGEEAKQKASSLHHYGRIFWLTKSSSN